MYKRVRKLEFNTDSQPMCTKAQILFMYIGSKIKACWPALIVSFCHKSIWESYRVLKEYLESSFVEEPSIKA